MSDQTKVITILNDLLKINHDRINGYEKALKELKPAEADLKLLFNKMIAESKKYSEVLDQEIVKLGSNPSNDTTQLGKIYRVWMNVKATFTGNSRKGILAACEFGEDAAQAAYESALSSDVALPQDIYAIISIQKSSLRSSHNEIKKLRDLATA